MKKLATLFLLMAGMAIAVNAQDVITLKNGDQITVKVSEISNTEIKYKRFDNLEGPTIAIAKSEVFAINYENGTREVINVVTESTPIAKTPVVKEVASPVVQTAPASVSGPHGKNFYMGIWLDPLGFVTVGPRVGLEFTFVRHLIVDAYVRFPQVGLLTGFVWEGTFDVSNISGIGIGLSAKYFTGGRKGGFYVGPMFEYWSMNYNCYASDHWEGKGIVLAANLGYKFQFSSGLFLRLGAALGTSKTTSAYWNGSESNKLSFEFFYIAELCFGIAF